jgi:hypothetical protein
MLCNVSKEGEAGLIKSTHIASYEFILYNTK